MTVSSTTTKNSYSGNGSNDTFAYGFKIFDDDDITVIIRTDATGTEAVKTKTTHYTVTNVGNASGGNVVFTSGNIPASGETVVLRRTSAQTQTTDYVANDPFPAATHEDALDKLTFFAQEQQEELDRAIKISRTNTMTSTEFTVGATDRANKVLAFDSSGEIQVTQEIGTFRGNWAASTAYQVRDLVKDTSTNNIFIVNAAHTSSGAQPLTTNANSAKYDLIVDAASATTSATNAATSETNAGTSETNAAASAASALSHKNDAETAKTASETAKTASEAAQTAAEAAQTAAEAALDTFDDRFLGAKASDPTVDNDGNALIDGALYFDTTNDIMKVYDLTNTQWRQLTLTSSNQTNVNTVAGQISPTNNIATVAARDSDIGTVAARDTDIGTVASRDADIGTVAAADTAISNVSANITDVNNFADTYFVSASAPASPTLGDLWFDTTNNIMKVYGSGGFVNAGSNVNGTANRYNYVVGTSDGSYDGSTTVFPATYDAGYVDVYLNGAKLVVTSDFTATNGTSVTLGTAANTGDVVDIVGYGTFTAATALSLGDNEKIQFGASQDLQIYHDGSNSYIDDAGTGNLQIRASSQIKLQKYTGENMFVGIADGGASLYHNNNQKLATTSTGVTVTGDLTVGDGHTIGDDSDDNLTLTSSSGENIKFDSAGGSHLFFSGGSEMARLDANGNFLVGATGTASSDFGAKFLKDGSTSEILAIHRQASDGEFIQFARGGNANGALSAVSGDLAIYSKDTGHEGLRFGNGAIVPVDNTGANTDNACNLGGATSRFADLYLAGGLYVGGTAAVNHLDDYEEGEFDITATRSGVTGNSGLQTVTGQYIKIGRLVFINFVRKQNNSPYHKVGTAGFASGQDVTISSNLPFAPDSASSVRLGASRALSGHNALALGWRNGTSSVFLGSGDTSGYVIANDCTTDTNQSNILIQCEFCYYTTS